jgi:predicted 2-oxoglutarate/Fe(II)-dependent dioxygenase YbiX/peroxiredoxin
MTQTLATPKPRTKVRQPPGFGLRPGQPAPYFAVRSTANPSFHFDTLGGRFIVLGFFGSSQEAEGRRHLDQLLALEGRFDDTNICFFGVSTDAADEGLLRQRLPGIRYFWDDDRALSGLYGAQSAEGFRRLTYVIDPALRVLAVLPFDPDPEAHQKALHVLIGRLPRADDHAAVPLHAPVLIAPRIFERGFCRKLIALYEEGGGQESDFMREIDGRTVAINDHKHKRRSDHVIADAGIRRECEAALRERLFPQIEKAFMFRPTQIERYLVACYDTDPGGHFRPHRDNRTSGTMHRKFAVSINLNAEEYEGGDLRFPEFGSRTYRAPSGGAVVFSCSLLHECTSMTRGRRYCFLPFLYDDEGARIRDENLQFLGSAPGSAAR